MKNYWLTKSKARNYFESIKKHLSDTYDLQTHLRGLSMPQINAVLTEMRRLYEVHFGEPCRIGSRSLLRAYEKFRDNILRV